MSRDANDYELTYWPITGLVEGEDSDVLTFQEFTGTKRTYLQATDDEVIEVWCRRKGVGALYQNIISSPIDLGHVSMPVDEWTEFEIYVHALGPIPDGLYLATTYVGPVNAGRAGWEV